MAPGCRVLPRWNCKFGAAAAALVRIKSFMDPRLSKSPSSSDLQAKRLTTGKNGEDFATFQDFTNQRLNGHSNNSKMYQNFPLISYDS